MSMNPGVPILGEVPHDRMLRATVTLAPCKFHRLRFNLEKILFWVRVNQGKSIIWLFLNVPICITISMDETFFIDMVVDRFI